LSATTSQDVARGIEELEAAFPGRVEHEADGSGGAFIIVRDLELGERWTNPTASLTFALAYNYPAAPPYPFYLPGDVRLRDGSAPAALQRIEWRGQQVVQVSLRHNRWDPSCDGAVGSVMQVRDWLQRQ
jgi:Prokaryotic E2 family E